MDFMLSDEEAAGLSSATAWLLSKTRAESVLPSVQTHGVVSLQVRAIARPFHRLLVCSTYMGEKNVRGIAHGTHVYSAWVTLRLLYNLHAS